MNEKILKLEKEIFQNKAKLNDFIRYKEYISQYFDHYIEEHYYFRYEKLDYIDRVLNEILNNVETQVKT